MISRFWLLGGLVLAVVLVGPARIGERLQGWMTNRAPIVTSSADPVAVEIEPEWVTFALDQDVPQTLVFTDQQQAYVWDVMFDGNRAHGVFSTPSSSYAAAGVWQTSSTALALLASNDRGEIVAQATATWRGDRVQMEQVQVSSFLRLVPQERDRAVRVSYARTEERWEEPKLGMSCAFDVVLPIVEVGGSVSTQAAEAINRTLRQELLDGRRNVEQAKEAFLRSCRTELEAERAAWKDASDPGGMFERSVSRRGVVLTSAYPELSVQVDAWWHTGGAHGNATRHGRVFDLQTGALKTFEQVVGVPGPDLPDTMADVAQTLLRRYDADGWLFQESADQLRRFVRASSQERRLLWEGGEAGFSSSTAVLAFPHSRVFVFQPYEIAPYAAGMLEVSLPRVAP